ncbi:sushi, von Willebrand factor type A, EGF and pentraxin domain-containing protein 1-like [Ptychodera flava]|uniref:sushi, von Willebrand factor type A, EGF and pentraxin domain-containing protein 1-like n=1 Tax=Ptychodera flava TaxID=63121 RepID=UPI00396A764E
MSLLIVFFTEIFPVGGCILPNFPSNVVCYLGESETSCDGNTVSVGTELGSSGTFSVSCDQGFLPKYDAGYVCVYVVPGPGFIVSPTLGDDACQAACTDPGHPALGSRIPEPSRNGFYAAGNVVEFTCDVNTTQSGYTSLTCQSDGQWYLGSTVVPDDQLLPDTCFLNCRDPGNPESGRKLSNNTSHGYSISFACNTGLNLIGSEFITCDNGTWSDEVPKCASVLINDVTVSISSGDPVTANKVNLLDFTADLVSSTLGAGANDTDIWQLKVYIEADGDSTAEEVASIPQEEADQDLTAGDTLHFTVTNHTVDLTGFSCTAQTELCVRIESPLMTLHGFPDDDALTGCTPITCACNRWAEDDFPDHVKEKSSSVSYPVAVGETVELTCNDTGSTNGRTLFGGVGPVCQGDGTWFPEVSAFSCWGNSLSFIKCPEGETLKYNVLQGENTAYIYDIPIQAVDGRGHAVDYHFEGIELSIPGSLEFNDQTRFGMHVEAVVSAENTALRCPFVIKVVDLHPPTVTCPPDILKRTQDSKISVEWEQPIAEDNVDLLPQQYVSRPSGSDFYVGNDSVTVVAYDSSGNMASCSFTVAVQYYKVQCNNVIVPEHGILICGEAEDGLETCLLYCERGYQPGRGHDVLRCIEGQWFPKMDLRCVRRAPSQSSDQIPNFSLDNGCDASQQVVLNLKEGIRQQLFDQNQCNPYGLSVCEEDFTTWYC